MRNFINNKFRRERLVISLKGKRQKIDRSEDSLDINPIFTSSVLLGETT